MERINREEAKEIIAKSQLQNLQDKAKLEILDEYWIYDDEETIKTAIEDGELPRLSKSFINTIINSDSPELPLNEEAHLLFMDYLKFKLNKTTNNYLCNKLTELGLAFDVDGEVEEAGLCPCCNYYSIDPGEDGLWDICPVCFWENGGDGPNHMTLSEAKENFIQIGAISEKLLINVDPEGAIKYKRKSFNQA